MKRPLCVSILGRLYGWLILLVDLCLFGAVRHAHDEIRRHLVNGDASLNGDKLARADSVGVRQVRTYVVVVVVVVVVVLAMVGTSGIRGWSYICWWW